jgi:N-acetylglucosamine-6-phosphate deacetylase
MTSDATEPLLVEGAGIVGGSIASIRLEHGRIAAIEPAGRIADGSVAIRRFDAETLTASVGLIDLQINGAGGHDLTSEPETVWRVGAALPRYGVTAFLPTLVSPSFEIVDRALAVHQAGPPAWYTGATPLGWHVEGPFLSPARAGAHDLASLRLPDPAAVSGWSPDAGVRMVTLAPELPGALEIVHGLSGRGIVVSIGHTEASRDQAQAAFDAGARAVTHLFNAMPKDHLGPGLISAALADRRVTIGLIPDGLHVDPALVALVRRSVGPHRFAIVTDAIAALGMPPGQHRLANRDVIVDASSVRLPRDPLAGDTTPGNVLAGSVLAMDQGVRNLAAFAEIGADEALLAATAVPATLLGLPGRAGLAAGGVGDVVVFDANLAVVLTIVDGRVVFGGTDGVRWH